jgi:uncharacterized protein YndB with AHSA1/START domain
MTTEAKALEREVRIEASPETVFGFLIDAEKMQQWMGREVTLDAQPGGVYRCDINGNDIAGGEFVEVTPFSRVVYTFGWEGDDHPVPVGSTTVEITLTPDGSGTLVRLAHRGLADRRRTITGRAGSTTSAGSRSPQSVATRGSTRTTWVSGGQSSSIASTSSLARTMRAAGLSLRCN